MTIPFYDMNSIHRGIVSELSRVSEEVIKNNNYVFGSDKFEEEFAEYVGSKYCVAVSSGTSALHLALLALGVGPGDEVITVSHTFRATVSAILYCGAKPVFVDIDPHTYVMNCDLVESKITPKTKCIMPVHLYGNMVDMNRLQDIAKKYSLPIVEDSSQAHGSYLDDKHAGTFGNIGTFSFYPGKGLGALGDAGAIVTDDRDLYEYIKKTRNWNSDTIGYNYRMATVQAEFLRVKLRAFDEILDLKRKAASKYNEHFHHAKSRSNVKHSYHVYPILVSNRQYLIENIKEKVELKSHYDIPVHKFKVYDLKDTLPVTEFISSHQVSLPIYPGVPAEEVVNIIKGTLNDSCAIL